MMRTHLIAYSVGVALVIACSNDEKRATPGVDSGSEGGSSGSGGTSTGGARDTGGKGGGSTGGAQSTGGSTAAGGAQSTGGRAATGGARPADGGSSPSGTISADHPGDVGIESDSRVIFHSDFESAFDGWTRHTTDASRLAVLDESGLARGGTHYLRAQVTRAALEQDQYISANAQYDFARRVPEVYFRYYARFVGQTATPHHWVRVAAGTPSFDSDGLANTVPDGNAGFWFDLDAHRDGTFSFYTYWYLMRSGRCNDGSTVPGCAGDQGTTYHYGNNFSPAGQTAFPRDQWICFEIRAKANTVGSSDGALALYENDALVGEYAPGTPHGRWLRDNFFTWGEYYADEGPFEGFDFRSSADVLFKRVTLDAYYQKDTLDEYASQTTIPDAQVILYDDVVVATERIGCVAAR